MGQDQNNDPREDELESYAFWEVQPEKSRETGARDPLKEEWKPKLVVDV